MLLAQTEVLNEMTRSPLGQTAIGWVFGVILLFAMACTWVYFHKVLIPNHQQEMKLRESKADSDLETQKAIAEATTAISLVVTSIDKRLDDHGERLRTLHELLSKNENGCSG